jgi:hypothetical protein
VGRGSCDTRLGLEFAEEHNGEVRFQISSFLKKLQTFKSSAILDSGRTFYVGRVSYDIWLGLEFDEEHNGEVRFQISSFIKKLQAFESSAYWIQVDHFKCGMYATVPYFSTLPLVRRLLRDSYTDFLNMLSTVIRRNGITDRPTKVHRLQSGFLLENA